MSGGGRTVLEAYVSTREIITAREIVLADSQHLSDWHPRKCKCPATFNSLEEIFGHGIPNIIQ